MPHRFFVSSNCITPPAVTLSGDTARQIKTVLRMRPGDEIVLLDNSGQEWWVELTEIGKGIVQGKIKLQRPAQNEPAIQLTLYQGTLKAQKFEWVLQKGTELGVSCFVPTICQRSVVRDYAVLEKKRIRWQQIIREAAEQSGRGKLPALAAPIKLQAALTQTKANRLVLMPWEDAAEGLLKKALTGTNKKNIALFIGPEGGFTTDEAKLARSVGGRVFKLGPRILRAETAAVAVCATIFYQLNEWQ